MRIPRYYVLAPIVLQLLIRAFTIVYWKYVKRARFNVVGREQLESIQGPVLFVANHISEWDTLFIRSVLPLWSRYTPLLAVSLPKKYYQTAERNWLQHLLYGGLVFKLVGAFPANKGAPTFAKKLERHVRILNDGYHLIIFPEGHMSQDGSLGGFRNGAAYLAHCTGCSVVLVAIRGVRRYQRFEKNAPVVSIEFSRFVHEPLTKIANPEARVLDSYSLQLRGAFVALLDEGTHRTVVSEV